MTPWPRRDALLGLLALGGGGLAGPAWAAMALPTGVARVSLPFELIDNRLFVRVTVNGKGPLQFIFDTGGANILDTAVAQDLGLPLHGGFSMPGAGEGTLQAWRTQVAQAQVGDLRMSALPFVVLPLEGIRRAIGFERLDGLIGHEVLKRFVVQLDFVERHITLIEPDQAPVAPQAATVLPIEFSGNLPRVAAEVDGRPARLVVDSGDRSSLTLFTPFVDEHRLREAYPRRFAALTGWGVGGALPADVTQAQQVRLGALVVPGVTTRMPTGRGGVFASRQAEGSIGTGLLKRLHVLFDYSRQRVVLAPNALHGRADPVDHSGLWLSLDNGAWRVDDVRADSAAFDAGLRVGQRVLAVDDQPVSGLSLPALRQRWAEQGPGLRARLEVVERDHAPADTAARRRVLLVLRDRFVLPDRAAGRG